MLNDPNGLSKIMKAGDICVIDRGFRYVVKELEERRYKVFMPALKGKRTQLETEESNDSRLLKYVGLWKRIMRFLGRNTNFFPTL